MLYLLFDWPRTPAGPFIMRDFAKDFYQSQAWKKRREAYLKEKGWLCEECLKRGRYTPADTVHHIIPLSPENISNTMITLSGENLEAVCRDCHAEKHKRAKRYKIDEFGRVETAPR